MALNNLPNPGQTLNVTRNPIKQNFDDINTTFKIDHVEYNITNGGKHNQVTFPVNVAGAIPGATELRLYNSSTNPLSNGYYELIVHKKEKNGTQSAQIPMTYSRLSLAGLPLGQAAPGFTYLPSGIYMTWFACAVNGLTTITVNANGVPIIPNQILNIQITPFGGANTYEDIKIRVVTILTKNTFNVFASNGSSAWNGFALVSIIGY